MEKTFLTNIELWAQALISISVFLFGVAVITLLITTFFKPARLSFNKRVFIFTVAVAASIWSLQFLADYVNPDCPADTWFELLVFSLYHTLKSFGAEDSFLMGIQDMLTLIPADKFFEYRLLCSLLAFCAPVTTATIFFEILSNFFPKIKLYLYSICFFKKKYFFSKLNEKSITLAKSILDTEKGLSPVIIFSDVYENRTEENTSELFAKAKEINAICLRDDIVHIHKKGLGERKYFLIDDNEISNLQSFVKLTEEPNYKSLKKSEVYLFCQDYIYTDVEKQAREKLKKNKGSVDDFVVIPVRSYRNLITNMLEKTPLYEPIVHIRRDNPDAELTLNVTILGIGDIGTEMLLNTYWMGQMLNCKLNINVFSKESNEQFWGKINYINPEIYHTVQENDDILRVYPTNKKDKNGNEFNCAEPYASITYKSCDIESEAFKSYLEGEDGCTSILDSHYILVSLGSDQLNLSIANTLKSRIGTYHIEHKERNNKTIINYVVYNASLSETLNTNKLVSSYDNNNPDIYMQAVGGIEQIYTASTIFMTDYFESANDEAESYDSKKKQESKTNANTERLKDEYKYWANMALRLHFKYKVFSVNPFTYSLFDEQSKYKENVYSCCNDYIKLVRNTEIFKGTKEENNLIWLEHRRWCAFLRTMGYRQTELYSEYYSKTNSHKHNDFKLHPCLVECDKNGVSDIIDYCKQGIKIHQTSDIPYDLLEIVSYNISELTNIFDNYKAFDHPNSEYLNKVLNKENL